MKKQSNKKPGLIIWLVAINISLLQGQTPSEVAESIRPKPLHKSPNVTSLEKYGDFPVNLFTGIPEISIPIFEVRSGDLSLPITLSYHGSGIRYMDQASWVGLGWSLMAGGQISRSVKGRPDEQSFLKNSNNYEITGNACEDYNYKILSVGMIDREPDLFSYTFPGYSGKFYLQQNGSGPFLFPNHAVKVEFDNNLEYFSIYDEEGVLYRFGRNFSNQNATEFTHSTSTSAITCWYLMEIVAPNTGDRISITYQGLGTTKIQDIEDNVTINDDCTVPSPGPGMIPCPVYNNNINTIYTVSESYQLGIDEIHFNTGKIKFELGTFRKDHPGSKSLDRIEIYRKSGDHYFLLKSYEFDLMDYFKNRSKTQDLRLKLDKLLVKDGSNTLIQQYEFDYHTDFFSWDTPFHSRRRDFFGFYNGKPNQDLIPKTEIGFLNDYGIAVTDVIGTANRETDTLFLTEGVLKRITYPTGGHTEFAFEPHCYLENGRREYVGGLRIKNITSTTGTSKLVKTYKYGKEETGIGTKNFLKENYFFQNEKEFREGNFFQQGKYRSRMFFSNSTIGTGFEDSPVIYLNVTEYESGEGENGKIVYEFDNNSHINDPAYLHPKATRYFVNSMAWARGKLTKKWIYNKTNELISLTEVEYSNLKEETKPIGQGVDRTIFISGPWRGPWYSVCFDGSNFPFEAGEYQLLTYRKSTGVYKEVSRKEILYTPGYPDFIKTTKTSYHPDFLQPSREEIWGSNDSEVKVKIFRYPYDIIDVNSDYSGRAQILKQMVLNNMLKTPLEEYTLIESKTGQHPMVIDGKLKVFKNNRSAVSQIVPDTIFYLESPSPIPIEKFQNLSVSGNNRLLWDSHYQPRIIFHSYDQYGNLTALSKTNGPVSSFLWGYNGAYPTVMAINAEPGQIAYTSFESEEKGGWDYSGKAEILPTQQAKTGRNAYNLDNGAIRKNLPDAGPQKHYKVSFWARAVSGTRSWDFMGKTESLDSSWRLIERDINSSQLSISGTGIFIDELRLHPSSAQMETYTYQPLLGQSSYGDPNNYFHHYSYDNFGRLETIKNDDQHILKHFEYQYITKE